MGYFFRSAAPQPIIGRGAKLRQEPADATFWVHERLVILTFDAACERSVTGSTCSTERAPWQVGPANHKWARNLALAKNVLRTLKEMDPRYPSFRSMRRRSKF